MASIHFSLSGEGRGHAARAMTLLESLSGSHRVTVHTFGDTLELLEPALRGSGITVREIPGARFQYSRTGQVDLVRTASGNLGVLRAMPSTLKRLQQELQGTRADLVISDFEPLLPRAARRAGVRVVALDHQSVLAHGDFRELPAVLRRHASWMGAFVRAWMPRPDLAISSSFYRPRRRAGADHVRFVGVLLRDAFRSAHPVDDGHVLAYVRRGTPGAVLESLAKLDREVRVYGSGLVERRGALRPRPVSPDGFAEDLRTCRCVVTSAGNQLVGEAIHLGKPVLAMPEPGNREQEINGWFLEDLRAGRVVDGAAVNLPLLTTFLADVPRYSARCAQLDVDGTAEARRLVESCLVGASGAGASASRSRVAARPGPAGLLPAPVLHADTHPSL